jgi:uncharacterized protein YndB with AHSA1/START domain
MTAVMGDNEIISSRDFDTSKEQMFQAWTSPELLARWWGPTGFTNTFHEFDLRTGGTWRFVMHGPDGVDYPNHSVFAEIVPKERIVLDHLSNPQFRVTATFEDLEGRTILTFRQRFKNIEEFESVKAICVEANEQNFDRLEKVLAGLSESP